jgi:hypothetical protein
LPDWLLKESYVSSMCPNCQATLDIRCFPALYRSQAKLQVAELTLTDGDACCYEHSARKAASLCSNCGRFLCALCEVQLGNQVLCPDCLSSQKVPASKDSLDTQRTKYDSIALALAAWPLLIFYFTVITAPLSMIMAIYAWKRPTSIVRQSRWRIFAAIGLSSLEILGMLALIIFFITEARKTIR